MPTHRNSKGAFKKRTHFRKISPNDSTRNFLGIDQYYYDERVLLNEERKYQSKGINPTEVYGRFPESNLIFFEPGTG